MKHLILHQNRLARGHGLLKPVYYVLRLHFILLTVNDRAYLLSIHDRSTTLLPVKVSHIEDTAACEENSYLQLIISLDNVTKMFVLLEQFHI